MERVQLTDRPGSFFVINRSLGQLRLLDHEEREFTVASSLVKKTEVRHVYGAHPKRTERENRLHVIQSHPVSYWFAGWLLAGNLYSLTVETGEQSLNKVTEDLEDLGLGAKELDKIRLGHNTHPTNCSYTIEHSNRVDTEKLAPVDVSILHYSLVKSTSFVHSHYFVRDFLIGILGFSLGRLEHQDVGKISSRVPEVFRPVFEEGLCGVMRSRVEASPLPSGDRR